MSDPQRELARVADGDGPAARLATTALSGGSTGTRLRAAILALAGRRGPGSSICPSDAARAIGGESWRELMEDSRSTALALARDGDVEIIQGGQVVDPGHLPRGPIRIRILHA